MESVPVPAARSNTPRSTAAAWIALIVMGAMFGLNFSLARIATTGGGHPLGVAFWQFAIGGLFLACVLAFRKIPFNLKGGLPSFYLLTGLVGLLVPSAAFFYASSHIPAGILSLTIAIVPITTFAVSAFVGIEHVDTRRILGVSLGLCAMLVLIVPDGSLPEPDQLPWVFLALASTACYTLLNIILATKAPPQINQMILTAGMFAGSVVLMIPLLLATDAFVPISWPLTNVEWSFIGLGLLAGAAWTIYFILVEKAGPLFTSFTGNVVTIFGIFWGMLIFGEKNSVWVWLSFATIMVALVLVSPRRAMSQRD